MPRADSVFFLSVLEILIARFFRERASLFNHDYSVAN
jgi:hypothetical protein